MVAVAAAEQVPLVATVGLISAATAGQDFPQALTMLRRLALAVVAVAQGLLEVLAVAVVAGLDRTRQEPRLLPELLTLAAAVAARERMFP
jgi:hypothetical protein